MKGARLAPRRRPLRRCQGGTDVSPCCRPRPYGGGVLKVSIDKYAYATVCVAEHGMVRPGGGRQRTWLEDRLTLARLRQQGLGVRASAQVLRRSSFTDSLTPRSLGG